MSEGCRVIRLSRIQRGRAPGFAAPLGVAPPKPLACERGRAGHRVGQRVPRKTPLKTALRAALKTPLKTPLKKTPLKTPLNRTPLKSTA